MSQTEQNEAVGRAIESAAEKLPEGWELRVLIERDSGWVDLYDPEGDEFIFASNRETFADHINDAVEAAIEESKEPR